MTDPDDIPLASTTGAHEGDAMTRHQTDGDRSYYAGDRQADIPLVDCPECRGEGHTLDGPLEIEIVCPRCAGTGQELDDGSDAPELEVRPRKQPVPGSLADLQAILAQQMRHHLSIGYGIAIPWGAAMDTAAQMCAGVEEWMRRRDGEED